MFETIDDLIGLWPSEAEFARDIGLKPSHVAVFKVRRNIPSSHWPTIIEAARARKFKTVTAEALLALQVKMAETA